MKSRGGSKIWTVHESELHLSPPPSLHRTTAFPKLSPLTSTSHQNANSPPLLSHLISTKHPVRVMATPDPVRRHGFQFDGTFTTADGIPFEHPVTLRRLCFPSDPEQWKAPNQGRGRPRKVPEFSDADSARILTRKFVAAQSRFYGVPQAQQGAGAERAVQVFRQQVGDGLVSGWLTGFGPCPAVASLVGPGADLSSV